MIWRWDQGRLDYFQYDAIKQVALALSEMEGLQTGMAAGDPLRPVLEERTGLPFSPTRHSVWRNYGRVVELQLLAAQVQQRLHCTRLCKLIAESPDKVSADEYLSFIAKTFYYPSPVFQGYDPAASRVFPFCAILKALVANALAGANAISLDEIFSKLIGNECSGLEPMETYLRLESRSRPPVGDELRQVRELMIFFSQMSFLKWDSPNLMLDVFKITPEFLVRIEHVATPVQGVRHEDPAHEILGLGNIAGISIRTPAMEPRIESEDREFLEGKKVRVLHLRAERSRILRNLFFQASEPPYLCDMCRSNLEERYPWTEKFLEIHHVLPLGSPIHVEHGKTSLRDLVGICPNCHRATHRYYKVWLDRNELNDFRTYDEARAVYNQAKERIVL